MCRCDGTAGRASTASPCLAPRDRARLPVGLDAVGRLAGMGTVPQGTRGCGASCQQRGWLGHGAWLDKTQNRNRADRRPRGPSGPPAPCQSRRLPALPCRGVGAQPLSGPSAWVCLCLAGVRACPCAHRCVGMRVRAGVCVPVCRRAPCVRAAGQVWTHAYSCVSMPSYAWFCMCAHTQQGGLHACIRADTHVCSRVHAFPYMYVHGVGGLAGGRACAGWWVRVPVLSGRAVHCCGHRACIPVHMGIHTRGCPRPTAPVPQSCQAPWWLPTCGAEAGSQHRRRFPAPSLVPGRLTSCQGACQLPGARRLPGAGQPLLQRRRLEPSSIPAAGVALACPALPGGCSRRRGSGGEAGRQAGCGQLGRGPCR